MGPLLSDASWVRQSFLVNQADLDGVDQQNRTFSTASLKFTDTTLGGNLCINPPPQFTRYADLRPANKSRFSDSFGMGRYYSEAIDDHNQIIYMRFGVPAFNKMTSFFSTFYSSDAGQLARTGRSGGFFYYIGRATGFVVSMLSWKLLAVHLIGFGYQLATEKPHSKFYYLKPTMPLYWNAVQTIVNQIAVTKGIVPRVFSKDANGNNPIMNGYQWTEKDSQRLHEKFPAMFNSGGGFDVYALATRAQRLARAQEAILNQTFSDSDNANVAANIQRIYQQQLNATGIGYADYLNKYLSSGVSGSNLPGGGSSDADLVASIQAAAAKDSSNAQSSASAPTPGGDATAPTPPAGDSNTENLDLLLNAKNPVSGFMDFLKAEWNDGGAFASFRVDATGTVQEQFSSQHAESSLAQKINSMSSSARETEFNFAAGNLFGGIAGDALGAVINAAKDVVHGVADSMKISGLAVLGGAALVDIPKEWVSSAANMAHTSYTIRLTSPYGNPISQMMNLYIPLAMLLAGALALSTGKQSYTSPFICEYYDKGRCQSRLGMIDSLSVTRGVGNTGWNADGQALGIEVTFSIADMSTIMHMPIVAGFNFNTLLDTAGAALAGGAGGATIGSVAGPVGTAVGAAAGAALGAASALGVFDDDNMFTDYMNVLGSTDLADNIYPMRRFKRNLTQKLLDFDSWKSTSHMASFVGDLLPSRIISGFYRGTVR